MQSLSRVVTYALSAFFQIKIDYHPLEVFLSDENLLSS